MRVPLTLFCNSLGFYKDREPHFEGTLIHRLITDDPSINGSWSPGMTLLDVLNKIPIYRRYGSFLLIGVGVTEAVTRPSNEFMKMVLSYILDYGTNNYFYQYLMKKVEKSLYKPDEYLRFISPTIFEEIYSYIAMKLGGGEGIFLGLCEPKCPEGRERWSEQIKEFNDIVSKAAKINNHHFVDVWNLTKGLAEDATHLGEEGHRILFEEISKIRGEK